MSTTDRDLLYALYDVTKSFSRACCDLLEQPDRVGPNATEAAKCYDAILKLLERHEPVFSTRESRRGHRRWRGGCSIGRQHSWSSWTSSCGSEAV